MPIQIYEYSDISEDGRLLLELLAGSIERMVEPNLHVARFNPKFMRDGWFIGRLDYVRNDLDVIQSVMLEGSKQSLVSVQKIATPSGNKQRAHFLQAQGRSLIEIELEGPGLGREL